ncbi:MAG: amidohydrolase family protein, partial [Thermodesulfobacteriota bacterium]
CLAQGMAGIGELAFYDRKMDEKTYECMSVVMKLAGEKEAPVLLHINEPVGHDYPGKSSFSFEEAYRLISAFPENKIILAHWGGGLFFFNLLKKEFKERFQNVFVDTAASPYLYDPGIYPIAIDIIGPQKILFGSDYPLIPPRRYFDEMKTARVSKKNLKMIQGTNAEKLLRHPSG